MKINVQLTHFYIPNLEICFTRKGFYISRIVAYTTYRMIEILKQI